MYNYIIKSLHWKLVSWKAKNLSFSRQITLCKFVLVVIPLYPMQLVLLTKSIYNEIEKLYRNFI
jgi:hypothetical protein